MIQGDPKEFRWVHEAGGREAAARLLVSLGAKPADVGKMARRLLTWTYQAKKHGGGMSGSALRALVKNRVTMPADFDVMKLSEFEDRGGEVAQNTP